MPKKTNPRWVVVLPLLAAVLLISGCTSPPERVYHIGILSGLEVFATTTDGFKAKMAELGYTEGKNIAYDIQKTDSNSSAEQRILEEFVQDEVDLIFAFPTEPAMAAKEATQGTSIPVVFAMGTTEGNDLIENVRQPGGHITGIRYSGPDLFVRCLEILLDIAPKTKRVWLTYDPDYPAIPSTLESLHQAAPSLGVTLIEVPVKSVTEIEADLATRAKSNDIGIDAILMVPGISHAPPAWSAITAFATEEKLPIAGGPPTAADEGESIFTYMPDNIEVGKLAASLTDKVLKGIPAGTIAVVTPEPHLRINYKTAQELGLNVSEGLLARADKIIR